MEFFVWNKAQQNEQPYTQNHILFALYRFIFN